MCIDFFQTVAICCTQMCVCEFVLTFSVLHECSSVLQCVAHTCMCVSVCMLTFSVLHACSSVVNTFVAVSCTHMYGCECVRVDILQQYQHNVPKLCVRERESKREKARDEGKGGERESVRARTRACACVFVCVCLCVCVCVCVCV